ncbi:hypothetical protein [Candidatus Endomicrobiellum agilis]|uniref:hypothetical protein n=1 Tax=Candidatus Endomicrobiellum agilis TaxID=3238957 RepID=UPI00357B5D09|nr:hypothetical protein [Endomicrobium sp.]
MKKIISVCLCICLMSGCDKSLRHGRPVNAVAEDKGSEGVPTHSLTSDASNASALAPSNTPAPTPEPSKSALPASGNVDTGSSVWKIFAFILSVIAVCGGYKLLYRFADIKSISLDEIQLVKDMPEGYKECVFFNGHFFDWDINEFVEEIPVGVEEGTSVFILTTYYYKPNSLMLKLLKTLLRKIFRIEIPKPPYNYDT